MLVSLIRIPRDLCIPGRLSSGALVLSGADTLNGITKFPACTPDQHERALDAGIPGFLMPSMALQ